MTFIEKLEKVQKLFNQICTCFIVFGENILVTSKGACFVAEQDNPEDYENVSQIFSLSDSLAEYLGKYYREAFGDSIVINHSQFYIADVWEARLIASEAIVKKTGWKLKWVQGEESEVLDSLAWLNPMNPHKIGLRANTLFNKEMYMIYDVIAYHAAFEKYDIGIIIDLIRRRYISICSLPTEILVEVNKRLDQCELTEYDVVSLFKVDLQAMKDRVRSLKPQDILSARIQAVSTFNREINRLLSEAGIETISGVQYEVVEGFAPDLLAIPDSDFVHLEKKDNVSIKEVETAEHSIAVENIKQDEQTQEAQEVQRVVQNKVVEEQHEIMQHVPRSEQKRYEFTESLEL